MMIIGIVLTVFGLGFFCWLLFTFAIYALPYFVGLTAGLAAFHTGSGIIGAFVIAVLAAGVTLAIGQISFATVRAPIVRAGIGLLYAVPAAIAGYHATLGLAQFGIPSANWREGLAVIGAILIAAAAWTRMTVFLPSHLGQNAARVPAPSPLAPATKTG